MTEKKKPEFKPGTKGVRPADGSDPVDVSPAEAWETYKLLPPHEGVPSVVAYYKERNRKISERTLMKWQAKYDWPNMRKVWRATGVDPGQLPASMTALSNWADTFDPTVALKGLQALILVTMQRQLPTSTDYKYLESLAGLFEKLQNLQLQVFQFKISAEQAKAEPAVPTNGHAEPLRLANFRK